MALRIAGNYGYGAEYLLPQPVLKEIKASDSTVLGSFEYTNGRVTTLIDAEGKSRLRINHYRGGQHRQHPQKQHGKS